MEIHELRISRMTEADLKDVVTIENRSFSLPWNENLFIAELSLDCAHNFTGRLTSNGGGDVLVGYICGWLFRDEAHILNIAVHPEYRRLGLGTSLLRFFCDFCRGSQVKILTLDVRKSNRTALGMYRKIGFRKVGQRPRYYADNGEDALILGLSLNGR